MVIEIGICTLNSAKKLQNESCRNIKRITQMVVGRQINPNINKQLLICYNCSNWTSKGIPRQSSFE